MLALHFRRFLFMRNVKKYFFVLLVLPFLLASFTLQRDQKITLGMETNVLTRGNVTTIKGDIYYDHSKRRMLIDYKEPMEYLFIRNDLG